MLRPEVGESQGCLGPDLLWKQGERREEKQGLTFQSLKLTSTLPPQPTLTPLSSFLFCQDTEATQNSSLPTCVPRTGVFPTPLLWFSGTWLLLSQKRHSWLKSLMVPEGPDGISVWAGLRGMAGAKGRPRAPHSHGGENTVVGRSY